MKLDDYDVDEIEMKLHNVENILGEIGRSVCDAERGGGTWKEINAAVSHIQSAIHETFRMRNP